MPILVALIVMGVIGTLAAVLVAATVLIQLVPLLIAAVVLMAALRRKARRPAVHPVPPGPRPRASPPAAPSLPCPDAWVLVAVWRHPRHLERRSAVIDVETSSIEKRHG